MPKKKKGLKEGTKHDQHKVMLSLFPPDVMLEVGKVLTHGAEKYEPHNWAKGIKYSRCIDAALRHIYAYLEGYRADAETMLHPLAHAICELAFVTAFDIRGMSVEWDDIEIRRSDHDRI